MLKLKVIGNYAPNLKGLPGSCYLLRGIENIIVLDIGNGNIKGLLKEIKKEELDKLVIIISHNHIDHSLDIFKLINILKKLNKKVKVYLPKKSLIYYILIKFKNVFDVHVINEKVKIELEDVKIDFCQTFHRGESYAIRIKKQNSIFVYTSDFSYVSMGLKYFCKNADVVLVDGGIPIANKFHLYGYHGLTQEILSDLFSKECNVKKVILSHLKAYLKDEDYIRIFGKNKNVILAKIGKEYLLFN